VTHTPPSIEPVGFVPYDGTPTWIIYWSLPPPPSCFCLRLLLYLFSPSPSSFLLFVFSLLQGGRD